MGTGTPDRRPAAGSCARTTGGQALITALSLVMALTMLVAATQTIVVSQLKTSKTERSYEHALQAAEAGAHAYVNHLNFGPSSSPLVPAIYQYAGSTAPSLADFKQGVQDGTYPLIRYPAGSQQGYFAGTVGAPGYTTRVVAYGWSEGVVRRVVMSLRRGYGDFAIFGVATVDIKNNIEVEGNVGTNGAVTMGNNDVIDGALVLNGPGASGSVGMNGDFPIVRQPEPHNWLTVAQTALEKFPNIGTTAPGGLAYLATHNDNALATVDGVSGITGSQIVFSKSVTVVFRGKSGGAHYYLTNVDCKNNATFTLDNAQGPITIWIGPDGGSGALFVKNNLDMAATSTDAANMCRLYCATKGGVTMKNNAGGLGVYAYNVDDKGVPFGDVTVKNNAVFEGSIIANTVTFQNNGVVKWFPGPYFFPNNQPMYQVTSWSEFE